jgi:hypothetical protein
MDQMFDDDDPQDLSERIREFFITLGGNVPMRDLASAIIDRQVLPQPVIDRCTLRGVMAMCRKALSAKTRENLPFAQPTGAKRQDPWLQLDLFTQAEAHALIQRRSKGIVDDYDELRALYTWCLEKFGNAPAIPELLMPVV